MSALGEYLLSVCAVSLLSGLIRGFVSEGFSGDLIKLVCGIAMTCVILSPLRRMELSSFSQKALLKALFDQGQGEIYCSVGVEMAEEAITDIIKQETEAYILAKAKEWNAPIRVDVTVQDRIPTYVTLTGTCSPGMEQRIRQFLTQDLGIPKENQKWT